MAENSTADGRGTKERRPLYEPKSRVKLPPRKKMERGKHWPKIEYPPVQVRTRTKPDPSTRPVIINDAGGAPKKA